MEEQGQHQMMGKMEEKAPVEDLLPLESSPYVKYKDLEEYKRKGYGAEGHLEPKPNQGGGTDAPTLSGSGYPEVQPTTIDVVTKQGLIH
ncbi:late embryogenesis abundant protein group 8 protein [Cucumis melo var. makuwa]|uniref:Late embryogenesis abundant protein group 8 protein n=2 Tax=Cucumis melo TaxID=3656 RepID=A0A5A7V8I8_CUCMM|nr:late embryogenesis abundant protein group 8 protein [Cucumis melo var. makuwa]TYK19929.1 late embryogenesis abundant protein group 8 protein [Cucumis melo var. makuwa]